MADPVVLNFFGSEYYMAHAVCNKYKLIKTQTKIKNNLGVKDPRVVQITPLLLDHWTGIIILIKLNIYVYNKRIQ